MRRCMINRMVSLSLVGLGGFLIGASVGLALGKDDDDHFSGSFEDESESGYRRRVRELYFDASPETKDLIEESYEEETDTTFIIEDEEERVIDSSPYLNEEGVLVKDTTEGLTEVKDPYVISEEEFLDPNVFIEFDRNTLIYYEDDDVLATDRDEVVHNVEELIGSDALTNFGYMSSNKDTVFVRNIKLGANFEIVREEGSYQELVLGLPEEDVDYEKAKKFFKDLDDDRKG